MKIYTSITELVGQTPLVELTHLEHNARLLAKLEYLNPAGSAKDRIARQMLLDAEESGKLTSGGTIIEPTSGNTGLGLAAIGSAKGYRVVLVMPESMSIERRKLARAYGAELVLTPAADGMIGATKAAEELQTRTPNSIVAGQFVNPSNPKAHYLTTGPELWADTDGKIDIFVAGVGTGGTITGVGRYLKEKNPAVRLVAVEPATSPLLSQGKAGKHGLQGIGANFIPDVLDRSLLDEIVTVTDDDAYTTARTIARKEGYLVGITSGAAVWVAQDLARRPENVGKTIVALLPDSGDRYLSTPLFEE